MNATHRHGRYGLELLVQAVVLLSTVSQAQLIDCSNPNNLCTGDPCVIPTVDVQSPCIVDFGARDLVINGRITIPDGGIVDFTADNIDVSSRVSGANPNASHVSLTAAQAINVTGRIDLSGRAMSGSLVLDAGGNIVLDRRIILRTRGAGTAQGGSVTMTAGGAISATKRVKIDVRGRRKQTQGGSITLSGATGVSLVGQLDVRGSSGGIVVIAASTGSVVFEHKVRAEGDPGNGGKVFVDAGGTITNDDKGKITANGKTDGGCVSMNGVAGIALDHRIRADGLGGLGGVVILTATSGALVNEKRIDADGKTDGGCVSITASDGVTINNRIEVSGGSGGTGGLIAVASGGVIGVEDNRDLDVGGGAGGVIDLSGSMLTLMGDFNARSGGLIEGEATGDITTTDGEFSVQSGGSIQLCAGGTLDLSGSFDSAVGNTCTPAPPSCPLTTCQP